MKYLYNIEKVDNTKSIIHGIYNDSSLLNKSDEELKKDGILVEDMPEPKDKPGYFYQLCVNPSTEELFYEYTEIKPIVLPKQKVLVYQEDIVYIMKALIK